MYTEYVRIAIFAFEFWYLIFFCSSIKLLTRIILCYQTFIDLLIYRMKSSEDVNEIN